MQKSGMVTDMPMLANCEAQAKGNRVYNMVTGKVFVSWDVLVDESTF